MSETYAGRLARTLAELGSRELGALAAENHWHEVPNRWQAENRRSAERAVRDRAEDAGLPEWIR
jgi:hypothetical protein